MTPESLSGRAAVENHESPTENQREFGAQIGVLAQSFTVEPKNK